MAVQARRLPHDLTAAVVAGGGPLQFFDGYAARARPAAGDAALLADLPCSYGGGFVSRANKRPRLAADAPPATGTEEGCPVAPAPPFTDEMMRSRAALGAGAASTSGRTEASVRDASAAASRGVLSSSRMSQSHRLQLMGAADVDGEVDALVRVEAERLRAELEAWRRRHTRALLAAAGRAASGRLRAAEAGLERALRRGAELEEKARRAGAECQAWMRVAGGHEATAAGLRATLDQLLMHSPPVSAGGCEGDAEDARSCCFEFEAPAAARDDDGCSGGSSRAESAPCRACGGGGGACVLLLPCRHLCLCPACDAAVDACPVCAATKNGSLYVRFS